TGGRLDSEGAPPSARSGQRAAGSGQRAAGSGQRAAGSGQRAARSGQRAARSGQAERGMTIRIAMWSGPRNISTAMMRAWGSRADTAVMDEPFYAAYLAATGLDHPMRDAVLA